MRNIGRASFLITRDGEFVTSGPVFELFRDVNPVMNHFDLWKVTSSGHFQIILNGVMDITNGSVLYTVIIIRRKELPKTASISIKILLQTVNRQNNNRMKILISVNPPLYI